MKRIVLIIPYFGNLPNNFKVFLKSCKYNPTVDFIIFSDCEVSLEIPGNVHFIKKDFEWIKQLINEKFNNKFSIERPYKLCDYKPAYGYLFEEYIKDYDFWGHCDLDLIFGNIRKFLTEEILENYEKIFEYGHLTIYKNTLEVNRRFMLPLNGKRRYVEVFSDIKNCSFDEEFTNSINNIYLEYGIPYYKQENVANIYTKSSKFKCTEWDYSSNRYLVEPKTKSIFVWNKGKLVRYLYYNDEIKTKEYLYLHHQARKMKVKTQDGDDAFCIIPNVYEKINLGYLNINDFKKLRIKHINLHYFTLRSKNLLTKIRRRMGVIN